MPNWCNNVLRISHTDPAMMTKANEAFKEGNLFQTFHPCPEGEDGDWYSWCVSNWGTKWDICDNDDIDVHDANNASYCFNTAWAPGTGAYAKMEELGFVIEAYYSEPGMQFAGIYENGCDDYYEDWGNADAAAETLPRDLDEMFAISENQAMCEEDNDDEEEVEFADKLSDIVGQPYVFPTQEQK